MSDTHTTVSSANRTYLHGDPVEGSPGTYYCQHCDAFIDRAHFDGCTLKTIRRWKTLYIETHAWRYVQTRRSLRRLHPETRARFIDDLGNLFRTGPVSNQRLPMLERAG
jgi:hypothetical protein